MKNNDHHHLTSSEWCWSRRILPVVCLTMFLAIGNSGAQSSDAKGSAVEEQRPRGEETEMDLPASFHKYYGQRVNQWRDSERYIAKLDIDGDMNYDGTIDNEDPADNGAFESTPPGLVVGEGELTKVIVRLRPYRVNFEGEVVIGLEVTGINRALRSGQFESFEEEVASTGRIRVWADETRTELLLDSADPEMRYHEWVVDDQTYPANLPGIYPRKIYVEGVSVAGKIGPDGKNVVVSAKGGLPSEGFAGDLRLLMTVSHRSKGAERENYPAYRKRMVKAFRTSFDHILFTVTERPQPKDFVNNNVEGVWLVVPGGSPK